ncbi:Sodium/calcium exchanger protein-domain-containing protein [Xylogone sp. PMI_703]|nr:Sodium/calcium exchanger protein-domain-containing protein [Xylogone sp. PMI_703]
MIRVDSIRHEARKEAWKNDSYNPFRKTISKGPLNRSNTVDLESGDGVRDDSTRLRAIQTEPAPRSPSAEHSHDDNAEPDAKPGEEYEMTKPNAPNGRSSVPSSRSPILEKPEGGENKDKSEAHGFSFLHRRKTTRPDEDLDDGDAEEEERPQKFSIFKGKNLKHKPFTLRNQLQATVFNSWINILILAAPVGIGLHFAKVSGTVVFVVNFIAIIPLAAMLSFATEEISLHVGETLGGLLNASFGNAVELIVAIIALAKKEVVVVQTSLIGSILSNLLLVMGMCFFFGGLRRSEQYFNVTVAQTAASLLAIAVASIIIPTTFDLWSTTTQAPIASISRGTSVIVLVIYLGYLYFQLKTHQDLFNEESKKVEMKPRKNALKKGAIAKGLAQAGGVGAGPGRAPLEDRPPNDELLRDVAAEDLNEEPEEPQLHILVAWATLAISTAIIGVCAEFMVDGINALTATGNISVEFVGLILLPIVGNAAEHATAVTVACKDKMDLAIGVAVGSSMQVALFLIPLLVVIGWILGNDDMTLSFDGFQVAVMFVAVLLVNYLTSDGKSNYLEGMLLQGLYLIIAVCAWYYPVKTDGNGNPIGGGSTSNSTTSR